MAKGSMSRRSGQQQAGGGKDESESAGRHERSFDQGGSQSKVIMDFHFHMAFVVKINLTALIKITIFTNGISQVNST